MHNVLVILCLIIFALVSETFLLHWKHTRCRCGRSFGFWIAPIHERHALMVVRALLITGCLILTVLALNRFVAVINAVLAILNWHIVKIHKSGKRKWPGRALGLVKVHPSGRLVVVKE